MAPQFRLRNQNRLFTKLVCRRNQLMYETEQMPTVGSACSAYRLQKLEVYNWGTFDREVFSVRPNGQTTLLVGQNGSGKSTLVDALLTLLVRPGVRNFNVRSEEHTSELQSLAYLVC